MSNTIAHRQFKRIYHMPTDVRFLDDGREFMGLVESKYGYGVKQVCYGYFDGRSYKVYTVGRGQISGIGRVNEEDLQKA